MMEQYLDMIRPHLGELWRTDEVYLRIRGDRKYLFAMLDADTRYWIARMVATHKGTDDVRPMFRKAREVAGKRPSKLMSDGRQKLRRGPQERVRAAQLPVEGLGARVPHQDGRRHQQQPDGELQRQHHTHARKGGSGAEEGGLGHTVGPPGLSQPRATTSRDCPGARHPARRPAYTSAAATPGLPSYSRRPSSPPGLPPTRRTDRERAGFLPKSDAASPGAPCPAFCSPEILPGHRF